MPAKHCQYIQYFLIPSLTSASCSVDALCLSLVVSSFQRWKTAFLVPLGVRPKATHIAG